MAPGPPQERMWEHCHSASGSGLTAARTAKRVSSLHSSTSGSNSISVGVCELKVHLLVKALDSTTPEKRASALEDLGRLVDGPQAASLVMRHISVLNRMLRDQGCGVRSAALSALRKVAEEGECRALGVQLNHIPTCLADHDVHVRRKAAVLCRVIAECGGAAGVLPFIPHLVACLESRDHVLRVPPLEALRNIATFGEAKAVASWAFKPIVQALHDEIPAVRSIAAEALGAIFGDGNDFSMQNVPSGLEDGHLLDALVPLTVSKDHNTRLAANQTLVKVGLAAGRKLDKQQHEVWLRAFDNQGREKEREFVLEMFRNHRLTSLKGMFELCQQSDTLSSRISKLFEMYCLELFETAEGVEDALLYIRQLLRMKSVLDEIVATCFSNHSCFQSSRDKGIQAMLNKSSSCAKHLARFCDSTLRKESSLQDECGVQEFLSSVFQIFVHLRDKDIFIETYRRSLARRLLNRLSISKHAEDNFIAKLTSECGQYAAGSLSSMLMDMTLSDQLQQEYGKLSHEGVAHEVRILRSNAWPGMTKENHIVPCAELLSCTHAFQVFYFSKFSGRKLVWMYSMGAADVSSYCFSRRYTLTVSTYQCIILMAFNNQRDLTFKSICEATQLRVDECKRQLASLCLPKHKVLIQSPEAKDVKDTTNFSLNDNFTSERIRVSIGTINKEEKSNQADVESAPIERRHVIDATIVRVMKAKRRLEHNALLEEVFKQCVLFKPQPPQVKTQIEQLIGRDFLKRDDAERNIYIYLP